MGRPKNIRIFFGFFIAALLFSFIINILAPMRSLALTFLSTPLVGAGYVWSGIIEQFSLLGAGKRSGIIELKKENTYLKIKSMRDEVRISEYQSLDAEVSTLQITHDVIPASVMFKRLDSFAHTALLNKGHTDGVSSGNIVFYKNALLGFIQDTSGHSSTVKFAFAPFTEMNGILAGPGVPVILEGKGAGFYITKVPRGVTVDIGEIVVNNIADSFIIGEVVSIKDEVTTPFLELLVRSPINADIIKEVFIGK
ncbi:MAG: hypothetical protein A3C80_01860 [Candidatus Ryanbacteria bacterium RIFCSPHIGHO2_02_FULL_45_43]|uniref:Cell shape-determining protein MreC n=1 Tax=Candidatus Ryanbacteria bacterium RIFCSPHIGHO2_01_45_13 TaxID=1802112 RepID=A0A1G2FY28_9BACT|nr:MAG: hypothetical protein A2718_02695 [Candidatus Ryanbacteria bacterium RIFCSPHIGHO2_01_FULL_44_130]OGZ42985.1 MAG: hypothetical protein A2W41_02635 [Candidatus Ryanbacteria bacterium RIFCSPHIGHO2_01_45_13]OGZ48690.1 MAG: hypothetical protein A3C80_01860 [Candidatus Ryanbacteria bacterium RIFCSPHIGHO2_02_FULL_45_43]OGZ50630.1 MAG: hypothetical protein A3E55_03340 [Candidatus Ryanbacteria bacterium RIFCSPHIGHO2_12_FULL_44_20]OGZ51936.1 MAG: hypothetical protein A3A17_00715 [Candidatus Ryanba